IGMAGWCRFCCKSLFALLIKNSKGYRRDVRVNMWGTSSPDDKLVSDLAKATEAIKIAARRSDRLMARKLSPLNCELLQQNLPQPDLSNRSKAILYSIPSSERASRAAVRRGPLLPRSWSFGFQINDQTTNTHSESKQRIFQCHDRRRRENAQRRDRSEMHDPALAG